MELLKRMDDASDDVRMTMAKTWTEYFKVSSGLYVCDYFLVYIPKLTSQLSSDSMSLIIACYVANDLV